MSLSEIKERVARAEAQAGRDAGSVALIAVSKVQPEARVADVLDAGHRLFGENRVQEAADRWPPFQARYEGIALHLVGPLQSNKARQAMEMFEAIHSVDRPKLARTLARLAQETGQCPDLFIQVNTGEEAQKAGVWPGGCGCVHCRMPRARPAGAGADVHPAGRGRAEPAFRASGKDCRSQRARWPVDGHER